jgi:hypothetical protein
MTKTIDSGRFMVNMDNVPQRDGSIRDEPAYLVKTLLSAAKGNAKLALSDRDGRYLTFGLSLAPAATNGLLVGGRKVNLCPSLSRVCGKICLNGTGHARIADNVRRARIGKSRLFVLDREAFLAMLMKELHVAQRKADRLGKVLVVRLNVFSDVRWETVAPEVFTTFPRARFYDYTKIAARVAPGYVLPPNYTLTFSRSETNHATAMEALNRGVNTAVVFEDHSFPSTWHGFDVIDGTLSDLRILDPQGSRGTVVALAEKNTEMRGPRYAGKRNRNVNTRGFVLPTVTSNVHLQTLVIA